MGTVKMVSQEVDQIVDQKNNLNRQKFLFLCLLFEKNRIFAPQFIF